MLEQEGLVIMIPRKGAQVAEISEKDLKDVLEVRLGLEELAVRIACQRITEEELEELEQAMKEFEEAMKRDDLGALAAADVKVHEVIYGSTHNKRLVQIISNHPGADVSLPCGISEGCGEPENAGRRALRRIPGTQSEKSAAGGERISVSIS